MGSNNQSTTEFEKLKEALFGGYGFKPDPHISHSFAKISNVPTTGPLVQYTGPITHIHNPIDNESILLNKEIILQINLFQASPLLPKSYLDLIVMKELNL